MGADRKMLPNEPKATITVTLEVSVAAAVDLLARITNTSTSHSINDERETRHQSPPAQPQIQREPDVRPTLLTVPEVAKLLKVGRNRVYELVASKQIPSVKFGARLRIPAKALRDWIETRSSRPLDR